MNVYYLNDAEAPQWVTSLLEIDQTFWGIGVEKTITLPKGRIGLLVEVAKNIATYPEESQPWFAGPPALILCDKSQVAIIKLDEILAHDSYMRLSRSKKSLVLTRYYQYWNYENNDIIDEIEEKVFLIREYLK